MRFSPSKCICDPSGCNFSEKRRVVHGKGKREGYIQGTSVQGMRALYNCLSGEHSKDGKGQDKREGYHPATVYEMEACEPAECATICPDIVIEVERIRITASFIQLEQLNQRREILWQRF